MFVCPRTKWLRSGVLNCLLCSLKHSIVHIIPFLIGWPFWLSVPCATFLNRCCVFPSKAPWLKAMSPHPFWDSSMPHLCFHSRAQHFYGVLFLPGELSEGLAPIHSVLALFFWIDHGPILSPSSFSAIIQPTQGSAVVQVGLSKHMLWWYPVRKLPATAPGGSLPTQTTPLLDRLI